MAPTNAEPVGRCENLQPTGGELLGLALAYRSWRAFVAQAGNRAGEFWVAKVSQRAFVALAADLAGEFLVAKVCLGEFWETCSLAKVCLEFCQDEHYYHSHTFALKVQRIVALLCLIFGEN